MALRNDPLQGMQALASPDTARAHRNENDDLVGLGAWGVRNSSAVLGRWHRNPETDGASTAADSRASTSLGEPWGLGSDQNAKGSDYPRASR